MKKLAASTGGSGSSGSSGAIGEAAEATAFLNLSGPPVTQAPGGGEGGAGGEGGDGGGENGGGGGRDVVEEVVDGGAGLWAVDLEVGELEVGLEGHGGES